MGEEIAVKWLSLGCQAIKREGGMHKLEVRKGVKQIKTGGSAIWRSQL